MSRSTPAPPSIASTPLPDHHFYNSLSKYRPLCYSGTGMPWFLLNEGWQNSLTCLLCMDVLAVGCMLYFGLKIGDFNQRQDMHPSPLTLLLLCATVVILSNISLVLTQLLNPGIRNPSSITPAQFQSLGRALCPQCNHYTHGNMTHCRECQVCIEGLDHHCGYLGKCVGGWQKWMFHLTLCLGFGSFMALLVLAAYLIM